MSGSLAEQRRRSVTDAALDAPIFMDCLTVQQIGVTGRLDIDVQLGADTLLLGAYSLDVSAIEQLRRLLMVAACLLASSVEGDAPCR